MKKDYLMLIPFGILTLLIVLLITNHISWIDNVYNWIVIHNRVATSFFKWITDFGYFPYIFTICIVLLIFYKNKKELIHLYVIIMISTSINNILKLVFARPRPMLIPLVTEKSYSFPSGHAMASMTFYGYLIYMLWNSKLEKKWKIIGSIFLGLLIVTIGYSRIYLNVHYISDVLAGYMISIILLYVYIKLKKSNFMITKK